MADLSKQQVASNNPNAVSATLATNTATLSSTNRAENYMHAAASSHFNAATSQDKDAASRKNALTDLFRDTKGEVSCATSSGDISIREEKDPKTKQVTGYTVYAVIPNRANADIVQMFSLKADGTITSSAEQEYSSEGGQWNSRVPESQCMNFIRAVKNAQQSAK